MEGQKPGKKGRRILWMVPCLTGRMRGMRFETMDEAKQTRLKIHSTI